MHQRILYIILLVSPALFALTSCSEGWDDDSVYAIRTRASFFMAPAQNTVGMNLFKYSEGILTSNWNESVGVPTEDLTDVVMRENYLWMANSSNKSILKIDPEDGSQDGFIAGLHFAPHIIAVGREQLLAADTLANAIVFAKLRNGKTVDVEIEGKPGLCIYNNARFYLQVGENEVWVYDEKALTTRAKLDVEAEIIDIQLDRYNNILVQSQDSLGMYSAIISGNADYITRTNIAVSYEKVRFTDYFSARFDSEYINDIQLRENVVETTRGTMLVDSANNFEVDFFESQLFYTWQDTMYRYNLQENQMVDSFPFTGEIQKSFHQYGGE